MGQQQIETKLFFPALQPFYDAVIPLSWLVVRVAVGWNLLVHGYPKLLSLPSEAFLKAFADLGFSPPTFFYWASRLTLRFAMMFRAVWTLWKRLPSRS